ncbi:MAG TPA: hypothetical protein VJV22_10375 [Acidobacteriaceae bacterium]|nr:hypothetical protein [Acidobacteriaceae bacterium]
MLVPIVLFAQLALPSMKSLQCSNDANLRTDFVAASDGLKVSLQVHTGDDHGKETHLCLSDYSLLVMRPDGASTERAAESIDDAWGRSIQFELSGLARSGSRVVGKIVEGGHHPVFQVVVFDLHTGTDQELEVPQVFLRAMPARCRDLLRVIGTTRGGDPVIGVEECQGTPGRWQLSQGPLIDGIQKPARLIRLPDDSVIDPLQPGSTSSPK